MKLVSMKMSPQTAKQMTEPCAVDGGDRPRYPWGLSITLDEDSLDKLGMDTMPDVGESLQLSALVDVTACSSNETDSGKRRSVSLQITDLALGTKASDSDHAEKLYGKG
jgi:hypothetical protein